jgi:hypothetical protein
MYYGNLHTRRLHRTTCPFVKSIAVNHKVAVVVNMEKFPNKCKKCFPVPKVDECQSKLEEF